MSPPASAAEREVFQARTWHEEALYRVTQLRSTFPPMIETISIVQTTESKTLPCSLAATLELDFLMPNESFYSWCLVLAPAFITQIGGGVNCCARPGIRVGEKRLECNVAHRVLGVC